MNSFIFKSLFFLFFISININAQNISIIKIDSVKSKNSRLTLKDSVSNLINSAPDSKVKFNPINAFISKKIDSINTIFIYAKDTVNLIKNDTLFKYNNLLKPLDSISRFWNNSAFDSIKILLNNSIEKIFRPNLEIINRIDTLSADDVSNKKEPYLVNDKFNDNKETINYKQSWYKIWFFIVLGFGAFLILFLKRHNSLKIRIDSLKNRIEGLNEEKKVLQSKFKYLENREEDSISFENINKIRNELKNQIVIKNTLDSDQLKMLTVGQEFRWITVAHSAIGKSHSQATPPIPCQDNHYFETLNNNWQLAIVCDGAGSAKMSHFGSKLISNNAIPYILKNTLSNLKWFKKGELPSKKEWENLGLTIFKETYSNLISWVEKYNKQNNTSYFFNDFASTVMFSLYNSKGVAVANIGDGRGGYLNTSGELKPLFTPFGGDESNGTIFITSPIWENPNKFIQTDVIDEKILAIFLLSDGMEKITFECSNLTDNLFTDANIPYKKFFFPVLSKIKSLDNEGEEKLKIEWKLFIESGNDAIINESDDKTLLVSFLK